MRVWSNALTDITTNDDWSYTVICPVKQFNSTGIGQATRMDLRRKSGKSCQALISYAMSMTDL